MSRSNCILCFRSLVDKLLKLVVCGVEVVVDDDDIVDAGGLGVLELVGGLREALLYARLVLGAAAAQPRLEGLDGGRGDEDVAGGDAGVFDLLDALETNTRSAYFPARRRILFFSAGTGRGGGFPRLLSFFFFFYLHLDVQEDDLALGGLLLNGHLAGAVPVAAELGVLDEAVAGDEGLEILHGDEVVVHGVLLAGARGAGRVGDGEAEGLGVALEEAVVERALADARGPGDDDGTGIRRGCRCCARAGGAECQSGLTLFRCGGNAGILRWRRGVGRWVGEEEGGLCGAWFGGETKKNVRVAIVLRRRSVG